MIRLVVRYEFGLCYLLLPTLPLLLIPIIQTSDDESQFCFFITSNKKTIMTFNVGSHTNAPHILALTCF